MLYNIIERNVNSVSDKKLDRSCTYLVMEHLLQSLMPKVSTSVPLTGFGFHFSQLIVHKYYFLLWNLRESTFYKLRID